MKKIILMSLAFALTAYINQAQTAYAVPDSASLVRSAEAVSEEKESKPTSAPAEEVRKKSELEEKRQNIEQKIADKKAAIAEKLTGKRAELCEKKQSHINEIVDTRANIARKHFDKFLTIQKKLETFVQNRNLVIEHANALKVIMDDSQISAQSAVDVLSDSNFECAQTDATSPGTIVFEQFGHAKQALKAYRESIKDYASAAKAAVQNTKNTETEGEQQ